MIYFRHTSSDKDNFAAQRRDVFVRIEVSNASETWHIEEKTMSMLRLNVKDVYFVWNERKNSQFACYTYYIVLCVRNSSRRIWLHSLGITKKGVSASRSCISLGSIAAHWLFNYS